MNLRILPALALVLLAHGLSAAFNFSWGPSTVFSAGETRGFTLEVDFSASTGPETITIVATGTSDAGVACLFTDVDRSSQATSGPQWRAAERLLHRTTAGSTQQVYVTPNYSGRVARFTVIVAAVHTAGPLPTQLTVVIHNGSGAATAQLHPQLMQHTATAGLGTSAIALGLHSHNINKAENYWINELGGPQDRIEFEVDVDFGPTPTTSPRSVAMYGCALRAPAFGLTGSGPVRFELHDLRAQGFATPTTWFTVPDAGSGYNGGGENARTVVIPAGVSGVHAFRVIVSGAQNMSGRLGFLWGLSADSRLSFRPLNWPPANARDLISISSTGAPNLLTPDVLLPAWTSTETFSVAGGTLARPHTWSVVAPSWLGVTSATGTTTRLTVTGQLPSPGFVQVILRVERDPSASNDSLEFAEVVLNTHVGPRLSILTLGVPDAVFGVPYNEPVTATGGTGIYTWAPASPQLPPGLTLDNTSAQSVTIRGTPAVLGEYEFWLYVNDGEEIVGRAFSIEVKAPPNPVDAANPDSSCAIGHSGAGPLILALLARRRRRARAYCFTPL